MAAPFRTDVARPNARAARPDVLDRRELGPWRIEGALGAGGMGVVYRATHASDGRAAALKTVRAADPLFLQGLRREIRALARLSHPGIVRILDVGLDDAVPWYAMELLTGASYRRQLRETGELAAGGATTRTEISPTTETSPPIEPSGPVTTRRESGERPVAPSGSPPASPPAHARPPTAEQRAALLRVFPPLCDALAFLHGEGIVHLDLKPDNVIVEPSGRVVLMDFGLSARATSVHGREALDVTGTGVGTIAYMSPEQLRGVAVDARADLYALGCMLYEVIAGRTPFLGEHSIHVALGHLELAPQPLSELADGVAPDLERLVLALLEKEPHHRLGYASDVARVLRNELREISPSSSPAPRAYLYRPPLVGRGEALRALGAELDRAIAGRAALVLVGGESGVGKTRLALELAQGRDRTQVAVHTGECAPLSPGEVAAPLGPFAEVLRAAADRALERGPDETARLFGAGLRVLLPHAPVLASLPGGESAPEPPPLPARAARARLVRSAIHVLAALAHEGPLLLLVDDVHWADDATLGVLDALAREPWQGAHGILVVATYRTDEITPEIRALAALGASETAPGTDGDAPGVRTLEIGRLDRDGARAMVDGMLGAASLPAAMVERVTDHAEGNPFHIAEYLRAAVREKVLVRSEGRWRADDPDGSRTAALPAPRSILELVDRRFARLGADAREVAEAAAVLGREFDPEPIAEMLGRAEGDVLDALQELLATQMAELGEAGRARFVHARLHEATYARLPAERRRELHGAAARAIALGPPRAGRAALLARHLRAGPAPHQSLPHLEAAGHEALAAGDHRGARLLFEEHDLEAERSPVPVDPETRARVARGLGDACFALGDLAMTAERGRRALALLGHPLPTSAPGALAALAREGAARLVAPVRDERARRTLEEAALAAQRVAEAAYYALDATQLVAGAVLATTLAARSGGGAKVTKASAMLGVVLASLGARRGAATHGDGAIARADAAGDRAGLCFALYARSAGHCSTGELRAARDTAVRARDVAAALGDPHEIAMSEAVLGNAEYFLGDLDLAASRFARIDAIARRAGLGQLATWGLYAQARSHVHTGDLERAVELCTRARELLAGVADEASQQIVLGLLASARAGLGQDDEARAAALALVERARRAPGAIFAVAPGYAGLSTAALALHRRGDRAALAIAREAVRWLSGVARGNAVVESTAALHAGRLALAEGRTRAARRALTRASAIASARGMRLDEGLARTWLAAALDERATRDAEHARGAALLDEIGAARELRDARTASGR